MSSTSKSYNVQINREDLSWYAIKAQLQLLATARIQFMDLSNKHSEINRRYRVYKHVSNTRCLRRGILDMLLKFI